VVWASAYYAPTSSVAAWAWSGYTHGFGVYPWAGRSVIWAPSILNNVADTNYAHELGHYLGLPHAFDGAILFGTVPSYGNVDYNIRRNGVRDPSTGGYLGYSDFWDLVYTPIAGAANDRFYNTKAAADADEPILVGKQTYDTPSGGLTTCSMPGAGACTLTCTINDGTFTTGSSQLSSNAFVYQGDNPAGGVYHRSVNVMGYQENGQCDPGSLSGSQITQLRKTLRYDIAIEDPAIPGTTGKRHLLGQSATVARPALYKLDFNNDGKRDAAVFEPPSVAGGTGKFKALLSPGFTTTYNRDFGNLGDVAIPADYDGDGRTDYAVWRQFGPYGLDPTNPYGYWVYCPQSAPDCSAAQIQTIQFGYNDDIPIPGTDFDGNPATGEIAVFRRSDGKVYWRNLSTGVDSVIDTGGAGYNKIPLLDHYDQDGKTDVVLYDPNNARFDLVYSTNPSTHLTYQFPNTLVPAGAGTAASRSGGVVSQGAYSTHTACLFGTCNTYRVRVLQVWSPDDGVWYTYDAWSGLAGSPTTCAFGGPGDVPVSGFVDRDNNGTSDYVIYRALETDGTINSSGTMYFRRDDCTTDTTISSASFNARDIVSASGDISGDGQSDIFRIKKDTMTWYVLFNINSTGYSSTSFSLGAIGAIPL
jgi:hypothetical protein